MITQKISRGYAPPYARGFAPGPQRAASLDHVGTWWAGARGRWRKRCVCAAFVLVLTDILRRTNDVMWDPLGLL
jgi:hypothetical protein